MQIYIASGQGLAQFVHTAHIPMLAALYYLAANDAQYIRGS